jgi:hypothetical protein
LLSAAAAPFSSLLVWVSSGPYWNGLFEQIVEACSRVAVVVVVVGRPWITQQH